MIDQLEALDINGTKQWILCRGEDLEKPIVLFAHGGPGSPLILFSRAFDDVYLKDFIVVHWDQRRAGKSFREDIPLESMTVDQLVSDGLAVVERLKTKFNRSKIILVGHSWGTIVASHMVKSRPEDFGAYVSVGTVVDCVRADQLKYEFLQDVLAKSSEESERVSLTDLGAPPYRTSDQAMHLSQLLWTQGSVFHSMSKEELNVAVMKTREYSQSELAAQGRAMKEVFEHFSPFLNSYRASESMHSFAVPTVFIHGMYDMATPRLLAQEFFNVVEAPSGKTWVLFDQSAHFPMYEEPNRFLEVLKSIKVLS